MVIWIMMGLMAGIGIAALICGIRLLKSGDNIGGIVGIVCGLVLFTYGLYPFYGNLYECEYVEQTNGTLTQECEKWEWE